MAERHDPWLLYCNGCGRDSALEPVRVSLKRIAYLCPRCADAVSLAAKYARLEREAK